MYEHTAAREGGFRCRRCGMTTHTDDLTIVGRNCPSLDFEGPHAMQSLSLSDVAPAVSIDTIRVIHHDGEVTDVTWLGTDGTTWGAFGANGRYRVFQSLSPSDEPVVPENYVTESTVSGRELLGLMAGSAPIVVDLGAASNSDDERGGSTMTEHRRLIRDDAEHTDLGPATAAHVAEMVHVGAKGQTAFAVDAETLEVIRPGQFGYDSAVAVWVD